MELDAFDEFGNYIGGGAQEGASASSGSESSSASSSEEDEEENASLAALPEVQERAVVLHEDRQYYPDASEVYGEGVETLVEEEDTQPLERPILEPELFNASTKSEEQPELRFEASYMTQLMGGSPHLLRNVALLGALHAGKTSLLDELVRLSHPGLEGNKRVSRYSDFRLDEQARGVSLHSATFSTLLRSSVGKNWPVTLVDCPGHVNFSDQAVASLRLVDGAVLLVDAAEGVVPSTRMMLSAAVRAGVPLVLMFSKLDRLILELRLPPADAYHKLVCIVAELNTLIASLVPDKEEHTRLLFSPVRGNVLFGSSLHGYCFSVLSFATAQYAQPREFALRLWGDVYFDPSTRTFSSSGSVRTFVQFILEPLYKIYAAVVGEEQDELVSRMRSLSVSLSEDEARLDVTPLLRLCLSRVLRAERAPSAMAPFVDVVARSLPSPVEGAPAWVARNYTGDQRGSVAAGMRSLNASARLMINVVKQVVLVVGKQHKLLALGRVLSGTVTAGQRLSILGERYTLAEEEDMQTGEVLSVSLWNSRYLIPLEVAGPGSIVVLEGVSEGISKTATLTNAEGGGEPPVVCAPLAFENRPVVKVAVEPLNPSELPRVLESLRRVTRTYPLAHTRVEESGEHVLCGTGELYMDSMLHDLRKQDADELEIKVSDPVATFAETVSDKSSLKCFALTPNHKNKFTMMAEVLDKRVVAAAAAGRIPGPEDADARAQLLEEQYGWDLLAAAGLWAFGPDPIAGPNALINDCLPGDYDEDLLDLSRAHIEQGFVWAAREGPLCEEPMRGVSFRLLSADLSSEPFHRGGGQVIPTARRVVYSSFLTATPRLLEPVYRASIQCPADAVGAVRTVLARRRGHIVEQWPVMASPMVNVSAFIPVMDSYGFETDLRVHTQGMAFGTTCFDHWDYVPGDPLDQSIVLKPLEPQVNHALAREFMVKTRRRKGLSDDPVAVEHFLE